jgi:hypothetical protein
MKHPGHTYGGFVPAISERGMTSQNYVHQRDEGKEGGIEHGGVLGVAIEVWKLQ